MFLASCSLRSVYYSCRKSAFIANVFGRQLVFDNSIRRSLASKIQVDTMDPSKIFQDIEEATDHGKKRLSIEQIYQKKSQLEHILLRPDTYIGSVEMLQQQMWIYNSNSQKMECRDISYVPGLYKIFDEIIVNAADNKQRDNTMTCIRIDIDADKNRIRIWNNGRGIPVVEHKHEKMYVPELIFGTLLTSSNYDDSQRKVTGGRNGYGAKLCNIFSKKFTVETSSREYKKSFKQTWTENMSKTERPDINKAFEEDFTCVTFEPDLKKFKMDQLDDDIVSLMNRRAFDVAGTTRGVKVYLNGKKLPVRAWKAIQGFKDYVDQYTKDILDDNDQPIKTVYEQCSQRWEVAITTSEKGFQQISFVNSIATTKGGRHVDHIVDQIVEKMIENVKKQLKKTGMNIKPFQIKNHMWVFVNSLIENPTFDSQTKETMTLQAKSFGSKCTMSEKFLTQAIKCGVVDKVMQWVQFKAQTDLNKKCHASKHSKLRGIAKLEDANDAGTKNSIGCTLILTEGDSAKTLAVAGLGVIGRDRYGVFPLRGKVLNVREATHKQIMENAEVNNVIKILGLQYKKKYQTMDDMHSLRYGKVMIMTDQDQDGSHIKGLIINFIHHNWPSLIKQNFIEEFITPIVKVQKGDRELSFFSLPEYEEWKQSTKDWNAWKVKYYKGLGTSTSKEAREYFGDLLRHKIPFKYAGDDDDKAIELAFSKQKVEDRKTWLMHFMAEKKRRRENNLPDIYLYEKDTRNVSYKDFIDKELVLFSNMDNERSIPSLVDGFKPGQRKVLFTCLKRNDKREIKVAQLAGSVAEMSAYHHGEMSLMSTIIILAQDFVGSNNVNFLLPRGQFGSRLAGGKDSASPRYIFTLLNPVTRALFHPDDDPILEYLNDDNKRIEPFWYCPIIPTVLINGAEGIGTGWSTKVPCFNPREIVSNIKRMINGEEPLPMKPWYKNFKGDVVQVGQHRYVTNGVISVGESMDGKHDIVIEITELPIGTWTNSYKESVLEPMVTGGEKSKEQKIQSYKEYQTDTTVRFLVYVTKNQMDALEAEGLYKAFKLQSVVATSNMILFDACGCLKRYDTAGDIIRDFYPVRLAMYEKRKEYMLSFLKADVCRLTNMARFIVEKITNVIKTHCKVGELAKILVSRKYDPDPIKRWKNEQKKMSKSEDIEEEDAEVDAENTESVVSSSKISTSEIKNFRSDYGYLVNMPILNETEEFKDHLLKDCDKKQKELELLANKTIKQFWLDDLDTFMEKLDKQEAEELADSRNLKKKSGGAGMKETGKTSKSKREEIKLQNVRLVEPIIDASLKDKFDKADQLKENRVKGIKRPKKDAEFKKVANKQPTNAKEEGDNSIIVDDDENRSDDELQDILNDSNIFQSEKAKEILSSTEKPVKAQRKKVATNGGLKQRTMHEFSGKGAAKKKATSKIESDDENIFKIEESDDDDDDFVTSLKKRENSKQPEIAKKGAPSRKKRIEDDNEEENRDDVKKGPRLKKQKTSPKKTKQTKKANSDSEAESINDDDTPLPVSRPARARKNIVYNFDEDEDDDENLGNDNTRKNRILDDDSDDVESFEPSIDDDSDFEGFSSKAKKSRK